METLLPVLTTRALSQWWGGHPLGLRGPAGGWPPEGYGILVIDGGGHCTLKHCRATLSEEPVVGLYRVD